MARPRTDADPDTPKVLDKALRVLDAFGDTRDRWTEADLRRHLGMPSSSLNRILRGLERAGYVLRDDAGSYRLGIGAVRLGDRARASLDLPGDRRCRAARAGPGHERACPLRRRRARAGHGALHRRGRLAQRLRVTAEPGTRVPLTAGATARSLLAFAPDALIEQVLARPREPLAEGRSSTRPPSGERLALIRANGWGISWQETFDGAWAIGAPLLDEEGHPLASIGVAAPISRHSDAAEEATRHALLHAVAPRGRAAASAGARASLAPPAHLQSCTREHRPPHRLPDADRQPGGHHPPRAGRAARGRSRRLRGHPPHPGPARPLRRRRQARQLPRAQRGRARHRAGGQDERGLGGGARLRRRHAARLRPGLRARARLRRGGPGRRGAARSVGGAQRARGQRPARRALAVRRASSRASAPSSSGCSRSPRPWWRSSPRAGWARR